MPFFVLAGATALGSVASAAIGAGAASDAASQQAAAAQQASAIQQQQFQQPTQNEAPFLNAGTNSLTAILAGLGLQPGGNGQGSLNTPFSPAQYTQSPGYAFQMSQGIDAIDNSASARGISGNTLKALDQFGQGVANQDYQQAYQNYTANQNQNFSQLYTLAGGGQNAAANLGGFGANMATAVGNNITGAANAGAAATAAGANAATGAINNGVNSLSNAYLLQQLYGNNGGFVGQPGTPTNQMAFT